MLLVQGLLRRFATTNIREARRPQAAAEIYAGVDRRESREDHRVPPRHQIAESRLVSGRPCRMTALPPNTENAMTHEEVKNLSGPELVQAYNRLTGGKVKRFASRGEGIKRVLAAFGRDALPPAEKPAAEPEKAVAPAVQAVPAPEAADASAKAEEPAQSGEPKTAPTVRTYAAIPGGKLPRPESKRGQLLALLQKPEGLTVEAICERFAWRSNDAKDALYHVYY
jgi:hypothetical protein